MGVDQPPYQVERGKDLTTGGEKELKEERYSLIPPGPLRELARVYGRGAKKYSERNWEKSYPWSWSYDALLRHAQAFWGGEDVDPETGLYHLAQVAWHAFALLEWQRTHPEKDDRPRPGGILAGPSG